MTKQNILDTIAEMFFIAVCPDKLLIDQGFEEEDILLLYVCLEDNYSVEIPTDIYLATVERIDAEATDAVNSQET